MNQQEQREFFQWLLLWVRTSASKQLLRQTLPANPANAASIIQLWDTVGAKAYELFLNSQNSQGVGNERTN